MAVLKNEKASRSLIAVPESTSSGQTSEGWGRRSLTNKLILTAGGMMLAIGGFVGIMELVKNTPDDWKQISMCLGVFWLTLVGRMITTFVWGLGLPAQDAPVQPSSGGLGGRQKSEDEDDQDGTPEKKGTRRRRPRRDA